MTTTTTTTICFQIVGRPERGRMVANYDARVFFLLACNHQSFKCMCCCWACYEIPSAQTVVVDRETDKTYMTANRRRMGWDGMGGCSSVSGLPT